MKKLFCFVIGVISLSICTAQIGTEFKSDSRDTMPAILVDSVNIEIQGFIVVDKGTLSNGKQFVQIRYLDINRQLIYKKVRFKEPRTIGLKISDYIRRSKRN